MNGNIYTYIYIRKISLHIVYIYTSMMVNMRFAACAGRVHIQQGQPLAWCLEMTESGIKMGSHIP
jgi:hypothetical protein